MCSKKRLPAAALSKTKVEVRKIGGFSAPSESAGSNPWPIINVAGFSLRPPSSRTSAFGRRRAVGIVAGPLGSCERVITRRLLRSEEHTSELQSLMRISYAVFCLKKKKTKDK